MALMVPKMIGIMMEAMKNKTETKEEIKIRIIVKIIEEEMVIIGDRKMIEGIMVVVLVTKMKEDLMVANSKIMVNMADNNTKIKWATIKEEETIMEKEVVIIVKIIIMLIMEIIMDTIISTMTILRNHI